MIMSGVLQEITLPGPRPRRRLDGCRAILSRALSRSSQRWSVFAVSSGVRLRYGRCRSSVWMSVSCPLPASPSNYLVAIGSAGGDRDRPVDLHAGEDVEVVGQHVQRDLADDLGDLRVGDAIGPR